MTDLSQLVSKWLELDRVSSSQYTTDHVKLANFSDQSFFFPQNEVTRTEIQNLWDLGNVKELESRMRFSHFTSILIHSLSHLESSKGTNWLWNCR